MDDYTLAKIVALRGLGYTHAEIAGKLELKKHQVQYALSEVNEEARKTGDAQAYVKIMAAGVGPKITRLVGKLG